jgi:hypothetical protein
MKPFTVPGLLRAAASYIEIHGHEQRESENGGAYRKDGPCCPVIAVYRVSANGRNNRALDALRESFPCPRSTGIGDWSDRTPTAEVLATMRRVARELDGQAR